MKTTLAIFGVPGGVEALLIIMLTLGICGILIAVILKVFRVSKDTTEIRRSLNDIKKAIDRKSGGSR